MLRMLVMLAAVAGAAAFALDRLGRARMRAELEGFGPEDAFTIAAAMTTTEAIAAGGRVLVGQPALERVN